jgi:hypothetical protein
MLSGESPALSVTVIAALNTPSAVGVKCPCMVQLAPAARLVPQLFKKKNEEAFAPVTVMLDMASVTPPVLVMVTCCDALVVPSAWFENERLEFEKVTVGGVPPVPLSAML